MSVGGLVGLRVMSMSGNRVRNASAFLTDDGQCLQFFQLKRAHPFLQGHTHLGNLAT